MDSRQTFARLYQVAELQQGCFTAHQASSAGYSPQSHYYHVRCGDWERLARGIFRLTHYPRPRRLDLLTYALWTADRDGVPQGVFSHDTALSLYPYSVWAPLKTHITVPQDFSKRAKPPGEIALYKADLQPSHVTTVDGVRATTPIKTLADLMARGFVAQYHLVDFIRTSFASGVITAKQLKDAGLDDTEWELLIPLLQKAGYDKIDEIPITRPLQTGARESAFRISRGFATGGATEIRGGF